jgi:hypothetical protein
MGGSLGGCTGSPSPLFLNLLACLVCLPSWHGDMLALVPDPFCLPGLCAWPQTLTPEHSC